MCESMIKVYFNKLQLTWFSELLLIIISHVEQKK